MFSFEITQVLSLGESTFIVARQLSGGPFEVGPGAMLGDVMIKPCVDTARSSMTHDEPDEQTFIFTAAGDDQEMPEVGDTVHLVTGIH